MAEAFKEFMKDLEKKEIDHKFYDEIYAETFDRVGVRGFGDWVGMVAIQNEENVTQEIIKRILNQIKENTEIRDLTLS